MTIQSGAPAATQVTRLVDVNGNPLGTNVNQLYMSQIGTANDTLPISTQVNLVAPRTDTASVNLGDFASPAFTAALFLLKVTAVSGTTPSMTVSIIGKESQGGYTSGAGGSAMSAVTSVTTATLVITASTTSTLVLLSPLFRVQVVISGTTPSFTWFLDMVYK